MHYDSHDGHAIDAEMFLHISKCLALTLSVPETPISNHGSFMNGPIIFVGVDGIEVHCDIRSTNIHRDSTAPLNSVP